MAAKLTLRKIMAACRSDEYVGFCRVCGRRHTGVEPDARRYKCKNPRCGLDEVYGAEELLIMGEGV